MLLSRKGLGLKSQLFTMSKKYSLRPKRREKSLISALTWVQSMCLGVGQKVNPLDRRSVSSSVSWTLDRLITVDVSRRIGPLLLVYDLDLRKCRVFLRFCGAVSAVELFSTDEWFAVG